MRELTKPHSVFPIGLARYHCSNGFAGFVIVIIVLGFMMAVSTGNFLLVNAERQALQAGKGPDRAVAASYSGIMYYIGILQATDTTFLPGSANNHKRIHFLCNSTLNSTSTAGQQIATWSSVPPAATYPVIATSSWLYASGTALFSSETDDLASSSAFMLKTYVDQTDSDTLASYVYVKSLGKHTEFQNGVELNTHYSQHIAKLEIDSVKRTIRIDKLMKMPIEYPKSQTGNFHSKLYRPWLLIP